MNKTVKTLLAITGIGALLYFFNEKKQLSSIKATIRNIRLSGGKLMLDFFVQNPSSFQVNLSSIIGDIILNGTTVATVSGLQTQIVPANAATTVSVTVSLDPIGALQLASQAYKAKIRGAHLNVIFNGSIKANGITIPIKQQSQIV